MKIVAKTLTLLASLGCCCWMTVINHWEMGVCILVFGVVAVEFMKDGD